MLGIYYLMKLMLFFGIVKALVRSEALQSHVASLGLLYTGLVALISFVFVVSLQPDAFRAPWLLRINRLTGLSPWLAWLAATLLLSTAYFKLLGRFDEGLLFWALLVAGVPLAFF